MQMEMQNVDVDASIHIFIKPLLLLKFNLISFLDAQEGKNNKWFEKKHIYIYITLSNLLVC